MPDSVSYDGTFSVATIIFDKPLVSQPLNPANWLAQGSTNPIAANVIAAATVQLNFEFSMETPFDLEYLAAPPDVVGTNGLDVEPFTIPVT